jgi:hypothetical protein
MNYADSMDPTVSKQGEGGRRTPEIDFGCNSHLSLGTARASRCCCCAARGRKKAFSRLTSTAINYETFLLPLSLLLLLRVPLEQMRRQRR